MGTHVIETIGNWGVKTTPFENYRWTNPRSGDVVEFGEELQRYPVSCLHCRISHVDRKSGIVSIVDGMGSAFLTQTGAVSISGGPFFSLPLESLEPTITLHAVRVWNWGDNSPGAGQGIDYRIERPVFRATQHPNDHTIRYATTEKRARHGGHYRHSDVPDSANLVRQWQEHDGVTAYLFDLRTANGD